MDDFAHLLLGLVIFKALLLSGRKLGRLELALALVGSVAPDIVWSSGIAGYGVAHTATYYLIFSLPFLLGSRMRNAAVCFALAATAHILSDAPIHIGTWTPFYPFSAIAISGTQNYWEAPWIVVAYWLILLALLALVLFAEKKKTGKIRFV